MRRGRLFRRRNDHQPVDGETKFGSAAGKKRISFLGRDASLLRLGAGIDLHQKARRTPQFGDRVSNGARDFRAIDSFDNVKKRDRLARLV